MSLGLLAKDSIQDFTLLLKEKDDTDSICEDGSTPLRSSDLDDSVEHLVPTDLTTDDGDCETDATNACSAALEEGCEKARTAVANPQQANDDSRSDSSDITQYAGFETAYHFDSQNDSSKLEYYPEATFSVQQHNAFFPNLIRCLFPWVFRESEQEAEDLNKSREENGECEAKTDDQDYQKSQANGSQLNKGKTEDDEQSANSDALGEKLSRKDRQAVLARLGLAEPGTEAKILKEKKGLLNGIPTYDTSPLRSIEDSPESSESNGIKGILKRASTKDLSNAKKIDSDASSITSKNTAKRRSLFPQYDTTRKEGKKPPVTFAPMARVVTVKSKNEMTQEEKADIWWQKSDYENFRKTGRMITKAIMEGGSQIWLSSQNPKGSSATDSGDTLGQEGDKWWHKFGHSRRGLEHVVSQQEGRERQINVRNAIRAVVEEHARQKAYKREDPEKLRIVALNLTSWARDLALAAGSSDADAVSSSFSADRKSREFYLLKMTRDKQKPSGSIPGFMQPHHPGSPPPNAVVCALSDARQQQRLDANTSAQLRFRQQRRVPSLPTSEEKESTEPVKEQGSSQKGESLAHRAAGFLVNGEKVDASGVLAGMGVLSKEPTAVAT
ncbi:hypothetical protein FisN_22Lh143 [Fistulifera solaris]|uniref:Uncharacterized protein n=1 Tax=Fistulifera solaris TaxID=1519565 RepID=A0A1Z5JBX7_FISSO|nr:hypothetical protein FisN_22Lh143 [Fistulifera solaris]|eukprot:GAX11459.1 hypothetical protein FisN_22Lh143 [Fistulifera solaris]